MAEIAQDDVGAEFGPRSARERGIQAAARSLRWGAIANGAAALLMTLAGIAGGLGVSGVFTFTADVLLSGYGGAADAALLVIVLLGLADLSALMILMVGVTAQEFWAPPLTVLLALGNVGLLLWLGFVPGLLTVGFTGVAAYYALRDLGAYRVNPLMLKELRGRMRGARAFVVMSVYLGLMSGFAVLWYLIETGAGTSTDTSTTGELGRNLFRGVVGLELLLIVFIAPAFTSGAISSERERKTYDLLEITLLPHPSFVIGKLESALGYILLLLLAAIPLQSIAFLFGGVSQEELILAFVILSVTAVVLGTVGLYFSTIVERTLTASVRAYTVAFGLMVGLPLGLQLILDIARQLLSSALLSNGGLQAAFIYIQAFINTLSPVTAALETQNLLINNQGASFYLERLRDGTTIPLASPWITFTVLYLTAAAVLIVLAVRGIRRNAMV